MKSNTKKVIIWVACVLLVAALAVTASVLITNYARKKPERLAGDFQSDIVGTWSGNYDISSLTFRENNGVSLNMLGINLNGTYSVKYDKDSQRYTLALIYDSSVGVSVKRSFDASVSEDGKTLTLNDLQSDFKLVYKKSENQSTSNAVTSGTQASSAPSEQKTNSAADVKSFSAELKGKWQGVSDSDGYQFYEDGSVDVNLLNLSAKGTYTVTHEGEKYKLKISYKTVVGTTISNSYYAEISESTLTLTQIGLESLSVKYTRVQS